MNLNESISLGDLNFKKLLPLLARYQKGIVSLVLLALIGYTGYQLSRVMSVPPAPAYAVNPATKLPSLKFQPTLIKRLQALQNPGGSDNAVPIGKTDPFSE